MAELVTIARPYAKAAFNYALENSALEEWSTMLGFASAIVTNKAIAESLDNPQLTADKQTELVISVCAEKLNQGGQDFIALLSANKRLKALPEVSVLFEQLYAQQQQAEEVSVISAYELSDSESEQLKQALAKKLGKSINLSNETDSSLIGGVVIRAGDMVIDASVKGKIEKLSHALI